jgi:hypothetical protein
MRWARSLVVTCAVTAVLLSPLAALAALDGRTWQLVASPSPSPVSLLAGVAVAGQRDVWAVGSSSTAEFGQPFQTLIEHWDGTVWSVVPSPSPGGSGSLSGVTALSGTDVWAVGSSSSRTLVEHWDGIGWSVVASPSPGSFSGLSAVATVSPRTRRNVWAVGGSFNGSGNDTLIEHWDGTSWSVVASPSPGRFNALQGVSAVSQDDVWAVGNGTTDPAAPFAAETLVEHWDGSSWSIVPSPTRDDGSYFAAVAFDTGERWAVGSSHVNAPVGDFTLVQRYARP